MPQGDLPDCGFIRLHAYNTYFRRQVWNSVFKCCVCSDGIALFSGEGMAAAGSSAAGKAAVAEAAGALVIRHEQNAGKGAALNFGLNAARKIRPKVLALKNSDGQQR